MRAAIARAVHLTEPRQLAGQRRRSGSPPWCAARPPLCDVFIRRRTPAATVVRTLGVRPSTPCSAVAVLLAPWSATSRSIITSDNVFGAGLPDASRVRCDLHLHSSPGDLRDQL